MTFSELDLEDSVLDALDAMNFSECTPVQEKTIPLMLEGRDLIGVAQTGTGKTAAYLLPMLNHLCKGDYPEDAINCVIMSPTRELAQQIDQQMEGFSYFMPVSSVAIYGGNDGIRYEQEKRGLALGADVVIATPGRLISHINLGNVDLSKVSFFILDEADRMLDMGFYDDIMQIVKVLPKERQTIMFSATMPAKIQQLAQTILNNPAEVKLAVSKPAEKIIQTAYVCYERQKLGIIQHLFKDEAPERVIIFASSKVKVKDVTRALLRMKLNVGEMHSDLDQKQRDNIMYEFRNGRINVLVATDIVARGIDIDDIRLVINYDVPNDCEDYVHRIGRTARANHDGCAITFVSEKEQEQFKAIETFLEKDIFKVPVPEELGEAPEYNPKSGKGGRGGNGRGRGKGKGQGKGASGKGENKGKSQGENKGKAQGESKAQNKAQGDNNRPKKDRGPKKEQAPKEASNESPVNGEATTEQGEQSKSRNRNRNRNRHHGHRKDSNRPQGAEGQTEKTASGEEAVKTSNVNASNASKGEKGERGERKERAPREDRKPRGDRPNRERSNRERKGPKPTNEQSSAPITTAPKAAEAPKATETPKSKLGSILNFFRRKKD